MVNYVRMEEVWRSYGPLEPIGPTAGKPRRARRLAVIGGVVAVCAAGAAAGLWLKPDLDDSARETRAERAPRAEAVGTGPDQDELAEAAALQDELLIAVAGEGTPVAGPPLPVEGEAAGPVESLSVPPPPPPPSDAPRQPAQTRVAPSSPRPAVTGAPRPAPPRAQAPAPQAAYVPPTRSSAPPARPGPALRPLPPGPVAEPIAPPPPVATAPPPAITPSFDCRRARTTAERMVCDDPHLAALDRQVSAELVGAMAAGHNPRELLRDQRSWTRRRDRAAPDPQALADSYQQRIGQLRSMQ